ncbi:Hypothetical predicted protein [Marmota monax]|uniref:Uncharacterized protein n=1 Tax=Marmota monax TaxID=9995 RepID=A0A5E4B4C2_MARMO|nr:hypothetical protein GHT09_003955 [Marmota monax]VTJ63522.1 Hypothetical predicted protein [Marmota monax]
MTKVQATREMKSILPAEGISTKKTLLEKFTDEVGLKAISVILTCCSFKLELGLQHSPGSLNVPFSSGLPSLKMISEKIKEHSKNLRCAIIIKLLSLSIHLSTHNGKKILSQCVCRHGKQNDSLSAVTYLSRSR